MQCTWLRHLGLPEPVNALITSYVIEDGRELLTYNRRRAIDAFSHNGLALLQTYGCLVTGNCLRHGRELHYKKNADKFSLKVKAERGWPITYADIQSLLATGLFELYYTSKTKFCVRAPPYFRSPYPYHSTKINKLQLGSLAIYNINTNDAETVLQAVAQVFFPIYACSRGICPKWSPTTKLNLLQTK